MAQRPSVTAEVTPVPSHEDVVRVAAFTREPFVCDDEVAVEVLAPGTIRRQAFEAARAELDAGAAIPSQKWRRRWSLLLGLDRVLHYDEPALADGTTLNPHQVDALSGTYAALLSDAQRRARGGGGDEDDELVLSFEEPPAPERDEPPAAPPPSDAEEPEEDDDEERDPDEDDEDRGSVEDELEELPELDPAIAAKLDSAYDDEAEEDVDEDIDEVALDDPNAHKRFWFEHATGAGKTVAAMGFVESCQSGGVLILTHRRNLVDQFIGEMDDRGYKDRLSKPLLGDADIAAGHPGPVTVETYQWFVRNAGQISGAYTVVICDEAHTALGDKTSAAIRAWTGPIFIGMTATGALIARHVTDLFPTQTSRFDLAQAARRGVISPLRSLRIPPGPGVRTIAKVPLRKGEVDMEFDQDELAKLLDQVPFNLAIADLYKTRFRNAPGVVYAAGVKHAYNVAESFRAAGMKAEAVSGETNKRELAKILADYEAGEIDVLVNAQLLAEGWNSPRATVCMHLAPTASKRIYQQRVGRVTRRHPGKEAGVVVDFVHPATTHDDPVVTLHSLLDRDVYRGGAIVVGPVRRGRGRRVKVERRVLPVTPDIERRRLVFERELWRIAVEQLDWGEQRVWAALAGAKASPTNWRRARAMLNFDRTGELRRQFLVTALERNRNPQLRIRAVQEIAVLKEPEPFDTAIDQIGQWPRDERREASRILLQAMADRRIGRRDQATAWIWRLAGWTRDLHEEYAAQRWPATKHLLGLLVNSSGAAHARNARRLVHAARQHDRRLQAALLAAAVAHTPEAEEVLREARTRLARKPGALSRDLLKDFPKGKKRKKRPRKKKPVAVAAGAVAEGAAIDGAVADDGAEATAGGTADGGATPANGGSGGNGGGNGNGGQRSSRRSRRRRGNRGGGADRGPSASTTTDGTGSDQPAADAVDGDRVAAPAAAQATPALDGADRGRPQRPVPAADAVGAGDSPANDRDRATGDAPGDRPTPTPDAGDEPAKPTRRRRSAAAATAEPEAAADDAPAAPTRARRTRAAAKAGDAPADDAPAAAPARARRTAAAAASADEAAAADAPAKATRARRTKAAAAKADEVPTDDAPAAPTRARRTTATAAKAEPATDDAPAKPTRARRTTAAAKTAAEPAATPKAAAAKTTTTRKRTTAAAKPATDDDAPATKAPARTTARKTAATATKATAAAPAKKATARKPAAKKATAAKAATATAKKATTKAAPARKAAAKKPAATDATPAKPRASRAKAAASGDGDATADAPKPARRSAATKAA